jgi:hypothetical protein
MPRKPSSVFLIAEDPNSTVQHEGMPPTQLRAWRLPLTDDTDAEQVAKAHYRTQPIGTRLFVVDDTKLDAYEVGLTLDPVDDPRLDDPQDG